VDDTQSNPEPERIGPNKRTLLLAVVAPFGAIALLAAPLIFDAARYAWGV
jgi:hypothetical protein